MRFLSIESIVEGYRYYRIGIDTFAITNPLEVPRNLSSNTQVHQANFICIFSNFFSKSPEIFPNFYKVYPSHFL